MKNIELEYAKRLILAVLTVVILGAGAFTMKIPAQTTGVFEIQVPFDFVVMGRTYTAAKYRIGRLSQANPDTLVLKTSAGKTLLIIHTQRLSSGIPSEFSRLTFSRHGETHFLDSIQASGESYESRLPPAKSARYQGSTAQAARIVSISNK